jgi:hypothetical protein
MKHVTAIGSPILENRIFSLTSGGRSLHQGFRHFNSLLVENKRGLVEIKMTYGDLDSRTIAE